MKKITLLSLTVLLLIVVISCEKEVIDNASYSIPSLKVTTSGVNDNLNNLFTIQEWTAEDIETENQKLEDFISTALAGLLELSREPLFKELTENKIKEQFDDDYNVLLQIIHEEYNLKEQLECSIEKNKELVNLYLEENGFDMKVLEEYDINDIINHFNYFDELAYIQIAIPYYEEVEKIGFPTICLVHDDSPQVIAFKFNGEDELISFIADEEYAASNYCWAISVNEVIDTEEQLEYILNNPPSNEDGYGVGGSGPLGGGPTGPSSPFHDELVAYLHQIKTSTTKDSGWKNKDDVAMIGIQFEPNCSSSNQYTYVDSGILIKIKDSNVNKWCSINYNRNNAFADTQYPFPLENNECFAFVIYEKDKKVKNFYFPQNPNIDPNCATLMEFRSEQTPYGFFEKDFSSFDYSIFGKIIDYDLDNNHKIRIKHRSLD